MSESGVLPKLTGDEVAAAVRLCPEPDPKGPGVVRVELESARLGRVTVSLARMREPRWKRLYWSAFRADLVDSSADACARAPTSICHPRSIASN